MLSLLAFTLLIMVRFIILHICWGSKQERSKWVQQKEECFSVVKSLHCALVNQFTFFCFDGMQTQKRILQTIVEDTAVTRGSHASELPSHFSPRTTIHGMVMIF